METISCHSNQSSLTTGTKNLTFCPPICRCYVCNMERIGHTASEELFENGDGWTDGRRTDRRRMPVYTKSSPMRLWLR